jgi:hypothetical protein
MSRASLMITAVSACIDRGYCNTQCSFSRHFTLLHLHYLTLDMYMSMACLVKS